MEFGEENSVEEVHNVERLSHRNSQRFQRPLAAVQRAKLYLMLASMLDSGIDMISVFRLVTDRADHTVRRAMNGYFNRLVDEKVVFENNSNEFNQAIHIAFGKAQVGRSEAIILEAMIKASNISPLLKTAAMLAAGVTGESLEGSNNRFAFEDLTDIA